MKKYYYYINLDERGIFESDVRDSEDNTIIQFDTEGILEALWMGQEMEWGLDNYPTLWGDRIELPTVEMEP